MSATLIALPLVVGCAGRRPIRYEPVSFALEPVSASFVRELPSLIEQDLQSGRLRGLEQRTRDGVRAVEPHELSDEALYGLFSCVRPWARGAELDLLVDVGRGPHPVTVAISRDRVAEVATSDQAVQRARPPSDLRLRPWADRVAARHGLSGFVHGDVAWTEQEIGDVAAALAILSDEERAFLAGVALVRDAVSPRAPKGELAFFDPTFEPPRITFFDLAFRNDGASFVGPVWEPRPSGAMTALHEFGHVIADAPLRRAYNAYLTAWSTSDHEHARTLYRDYRSMGRQGPVLDAWRGFRGRRPGPSRYGMRSVPESFAEAFALFHLDPDALDRVLPGAVAWFAGRAHLDAARPPAPE